MSNIKLTEMSHVTHYYFDPEEITYIITLVLNDLILQTNSLRKRYMDWV